MTVEIKELVIKARVADSVEPGDERPPAGETDIRSIVDACVAEVLKIIKREKER